MPQQPFHRSRRRSVLAIMLALLLVPLDSAQQLTLDFPQVQSM